MGGQHVFRFLVYLVTCSLSIDAFSISSSANVAALHRRSLLNSGLTWTSAIPTSSTIAGGNSKRPHMSPALTFLASSPDNENAATDATSSEDSEESRRKSVENFMASAENARAVEEEIRRRTSSSSSSVASSTSVSTGAKDSSPPTKRYPIEAPSPILLSGAMLIAICASISLLEVFTGGSPAIGTVPSIALAVVGFPASIFLIYAAIKKGEVETEEDDERYMRGQ
eukprot:CAMPEP_0113311796 /NCGR_PEP_ID=MMETSP0010_2-20120614/8879_1 /TAXON_ID=216773 ORGANISM="Corethron hystrix, Strain 308" /NCGR_SAMPLE_ID=MMETSP0010_2 /ASSEMBLY_ACC=CAM_ASM_000155 /LENGTH=225 /DNA_ID=CAMNT_0000167485 /DNA_START=31 /DNA_END=708 /DNA_ORIENTATION=+ /assembly_acc=CAM_ASM_000155